MYVIVLQTEWQMSLSVRRSLMTTHAADSRLYSLLTGLRTVINHQRTNLSRRSLSNCRSYHNALLTFIVTWFINHT